MQTNNSNIVDVLSGRESVKIEVAVNQKSIAIIGAVIFFAVLMSVVIAKKVS